MTMLAALARAYDRMPSLPRPGYSTENISFVVSLHPDGRVASVTDLRVEAGRRRRARAMQVPAAFKRTGSGVSAFILWDKSSYALGITATLSERTPREHEAFKVRQRELFSKSDDEGLIALLQFLDRWMPTNFQPPLWPPDMLDTNIAFALESDRLDGLFLHDRPAARKRIAALAAADAEGPICLVEGTRGPLARLHPAIKNVWNAQTAGASIVSYNAEAYESYGHSQGDNAQISESAAFKYTTALNAMLASSTNRVQVGDASTVFWADAGDAEARQVAEDAFLAMVNGVDEAQQAKNVGIVLERIRKGLPWLTAVSDLIPDVAQGVRFHVLGLAPNAARISVRFWFEDDFGTLAENYRRFVADLQVEPTPREHFPPLWRYLIETAVLGKAENVQPNLAAEWIRAILGGTRYPMTMLSAVLMRIRADGDVNGLRVSLLKALLVRNFNLEREATVAFDPENRNKGYLLGRLFAVYEQVQVAALGRNVNATVKDKFYAAASASPRRIFTLLDRNAVNHLSKVGKQRPGQRVNLEKSLGEIMAAMAPGGDPFPAALPAEDQALFGLGYYHQRNAYFSRPDAQGPEGDNQ